MRCDIGRLQAYVDDALPAKERLATEEHVVNCTVCRAELAVLRRRGVDVDVHLSALDPEPHNMPNAAEALARFRALVEPAETSRRTILKGRIEVIKQTLLSDRWRPAVIGVMALAIVAALFSFAPVRHAAAQFLGIFRIRKFAVIPVDPEQVARLESLDNLADTGVFGESTILREPGDLQVAADTAEASVLAGFPVRTPATLPEGSRLKEISVETGPLIHFDVERGMVELALAAAGLTDVSLPPFDTLPVEADFPAMVQQTYYAGGTQITVLQMPSPTLTVPAGIDPAVFGEILLRLLGMPAEDARRTAQSIDWTSTLIIPMPTDVGSFHEVEVDGVTGLLLEEQHKNRPYRRVHRMVLWQREGMIYAIQGAAEPTDLLMMANSLQ